MPRVDRPNRRAPHLLRSRSPNPWSPLWFRRPDLADAGRDLYWIHGVVGQCRVLGTCGTGRAGEDPQWPPIALSPMLANRRRNRRPVRRTTWKSLPLAEVEKRLGSRRTASPRPRPQSGWPNTGPTRSQEKKANPLLKLLTYFWGPIPWMIEAAVILSAVLRHWPDFFIILVLARGQRRGRILGRAPGGQGHRRPEGRAGDQGPGET